MVAIVGSRRYADPGAVWSFVDQLPAATVVVSGGAAGVDSWAASRARNRGLLVRTYLPAFERCGGIADEAARRACIKRAPLERNQRIVDACDRLVAFWDGASTGTAHAIRLARKDMKPVEVHLSPGSVRVE